ncbi:PREDICTED: metastasis suppressor protein 1 isoform X3 [Gavialis gangeticus]|uniref:metastasis suppressor protein 1 isoform X3 n=1 Tax=Gavialis gangeticus TaxID=94835 RepID=UPI00092FBA6A|nr:PREDICTED: metastasis suppressor protein 1 isoform X3 [Gavialis gangeticus]
MEAVIEKECSALGGLFQTIISDMKGSYPAWEDFINKAGKLQSQLRTTVVAAAAFLDAFQKVADMATNTRGGTREIGSALTRMCMRHRSIESKLRQFSSALIDCLINPLQEQMEEWKKVANQLDKDHAKEYKKARQEIKKKSSDTLKLQKKAKKAEALGRGDIQPQLDSALQDVNDKYLLLEETEKQAVRKALIEERGRFCTFVSMLRPVIEEEISMLGEITHLQTISDDLKSLTMDPHKLPSSSEQVILDLKGSDYSWSYQTPPSSPSTTMSRKSSVCSSNLPQQAPMRLSSVSSHDSGFMSQDAFQSKSPSPMPPEAPNQNSSSSASSEASETCQSVSECSSPTSVSSGSTMGAWASTEKLYNGFYHCSLPSDPSVASFGAGSFPHYLPASRAWSRASSALHPDYVHYYTIGPGMLPSSKIPSWKDWAKPGPYDQPMANTLQRRKEKREPDPNGGAQSGPLLPVEEAQRPRSMTVSTAARQGEEMEACEELALALTRGLQLDTQRSSRDSLQCSSGYSTQTTTPCCSEDTIPSQELAVSKEGLSRIPFPLHQQNCGLSLDQLHLGKSVKVSDYDYFSVSGDQEAEQQEFDKSSTIPRNSDISQSYRRMFQAKRPASTAGLPTTLGPVIVTPGVATIRRTPSTKPSVRRGTIGAGPIPIKTPVIPVKTPTVPDVPGGLPGTLAGAEESAEQSPESPLADGGQGAMPSSWSGQASVNPPPPSQKLSTTDEQRQAVPESEGEESEKESSSMLAPPCQPQSDLGDMSPGDAPQGEDMLNAIRRGVKLKKTTTNDRSAPRIS